MQKPKERFRFCRNKVCRALFPLGRGSSSYCSKCVRERAAERKKKRQERRKDLKYPGGFAKARKQMNIVAVERQCAICLISERDYIKQGGALGMHHIILAKVADEVGNAHEEFNLVPLCSSCHGKMRPADEALLHNDWVTWVNECRIAGLPDQFLKDALDGYGIGWNRLPL